MPSEKLVRVFVRKLFVPVDYVAYETTIFSGLGAGIVIKHKEMRVRYEKVLDGRSKDIAEDAKKLADRCGADFEIVDVGGFNPIHRFFTMRVLKTLPALALHGIGTFDLERKDASAAMKDVVEAGSGMVVR